MKQDGMEITTEFIRLDSFLKMCGAVDTGGQAKIIIQEGFVKVNGDICTMRGKKMHVGDKAEYNNIIYEVYAQC